MKSTLFRNLQMKNSHNQVRVIAGLLAVIGVVGLTGCRKPGNDAAKTDAKGAGGKTASPTATQVGVTPARTGTITQTQQVTGALSAQNDVTVGSKLAGKISFVYYREGDTVHRGAVVVQQDVSDFSAQLDQQRANLRQAQTRLAQARETLANALTTVKLTDQQTASAVSQAKAGLTAAQQSAAVVKTGARTQERQQAQQAVSQAQADRESNVADLASAQADYNRAQSDLRRYQSLFKQNAIPAQQLDQAQAVSESGLARVNAAKAKIASTDARVRSAQENLSLVQEGSRAEDVARAEATVEQSRQTLITAQANRSQVNLRRADVTTAQAGVQQAQASIQQAEAAVRLAQQALADAAIRAPIEGVVAERRVEPGQQVAAGFGVMRIVALDSIYFDAQLPESLYAQVTPGKTVSVTVSAFPNRTFQGAVKQIFPVASSTARNFTVRIGLRNEGSTLRPQMFARGEIVLNTHSNVVLVPRDAVLDNDGKTGRLFVVNNKIAGERKVKIGYSNLKDVEVTSGLKPGDQVITLGQAQVQDKSPVEILKPGNSG